jgi:hypothetical protein
MAKREPQTISIKELTSYYIINILFLTVWVWIV